MRLIITCGRVILRGGIVVIACIRRGFHKGQCAERGDSREHGENVETTNLLPTSSQPLYQPPPSLSTNLLPTSFQPLYQPPTNLPPNLLIFYKFYRQRGWQKSCIYRGLVSKVAKASLSFFPLQAVLNIIVIPPLYCFPIVL